MHANSALSVTFFTTHDLRFSLHEVDICGQGLCT